jgi:hypothetical protein
MGQGVRSIGDSLGKTGLATAAKSGRIVAMLPDPVKHAIWRLAIHARLDNVIAGAISYFPDAGGQPQRLHRFGLRGVPGQGLS